MSEPDKIENKNGIEYAMWMRGADIEVRIRVQEDDYQHESYSRYPTVEEMLIGRMYQAREHHHTIRERRAQQAEREYFRQKEEEREAANRHYLLNS